jgi:hypothetical protein
MTHPALCPHTWTARSSSPAEARYTCTLCGSAGLRARGTATIRALVTVAAPAETVFNTGAREGDVVRRDGAIVFGRGRSTRG